MHCMGDNQANMEIGHFPMTQGHCWQIQHVVTSANVSEHSVYAGLSTLGCVLKQIALHAYIHVHACNVL